MKKTLVFIFSILGSSISAQFSTTSPINGNYYTTSTAKLGIGTGVAPTTTSATVEISGDTKLLNGNLVLTDRYKKIYFGNTTETAGGGNGFITGDDLQYLKLFLYHPSFVRLSNNLPGTNIDKGLVVRNNRVGVNVIDPTDALHVNVLGSTARFDVSNEGLGSTDWPHKIYLGFNNKLGITFIPNKANNAWFHIHQTLQNSLQISTGTTAGGDPLITFKGDGKVVIGKNVPNSTLDADYKLAVNGKIVAKEIVAITDASNWAVFPDYVFDKDYKLRSLDSLSKFIATNKHLPEIPSAEDVRKEGLNMTQLQILQMKKIEELTLYILAQQKELDLLKKEIALLKK
ncbi:MAG: hypothetical protein U0V72_05450 [Cytophagales bacterium]